MIKEENSQVFISVTHAAELLNRTNRHIRRMCETGKLVGSVKRGRRWMIPKPIKDCVQLSGSLKGNDKFQHFLYGHLQTIVALQSECRRELIRLLCHSQNMTGYYRKWQFLRRLLDRQGMYMHETLRDLDQAIPNPNSKEFLDLPASKYQSAVKKVSVIQDLEKFLALFVCNGGNRSDAIRAYAAQRQISERTLARWLAKYQDKGLLGLVDRREMS